MGLIYIITHARRINDVMTWSKWQCSQTWFCNFCTLIFFFNKPDHELLCVCVFLLLFLESFLSESWCFFTYGLLQFSGLCSQLCDVPEQTGTAYRTRKLTCADYTWLWRCDGVLSVLQFVVTVSSAVWDGWADRHSVKDQKAHLCRLHLAVEVSFHYSCLLYLCPYLWDDRGDWHSVQDQKADLCRLHLAVEVWWCPFSTPVCCICVLSCLRWSSRPALCTGPESCPVLTTPGCGGVTESRDNSPSCWRERELVCLFV